MRFVKTKQTKRFQFGIDRNTRSHQRGANTVSIGTRDSGNEFSVSSSRITMTVKEAKALQNFLNTHLSVSDTVTTR
jgi:hypothetical protein